MESRLLEVIVEIGRSCSPNTLGALDSVLRRLEGPCSEDRLARAAMTDSAKHLARELASAWAECPEQSGQSIALALESASQTAAQHRDERSIEIVWTGPATEAVPLRRSDRVLVELIQGARERILIVSFAAYKVADVLKALQEALNRSVRVDLVLESKIESGGKLSHDGLDAVKDLDGDVSVWVWPAEKRKMDERSNRGVLHAKCAVADGRVAVVTSANLTDYALDSNMELGIRIEGGPEPEKVERHFRALMDREVLVKV